MLPFLNCSLGMSQSETGELKGGEQSLRKSRKLYAAKEKLSDEGDCLYELGTLEVKRKDDVAALQLGRVLAATGKAVDAQKLITPAKKLRDVLYPKGHPAHSITKQIEAELALALGHAEESVELYSQSLKLRDEKYPADHPETKVLLGDYLKALEKAGTSGDVKTIRARLGGKCLGSGKQKSGIRESNSFHSAPFTMSRNLTVKPFPQHNRHRPASQCQSANRKVLPQGVG